MLHRVHTGKDRVEHTDPALGVRRDRHLALVRLLDGRGHLLDRELRLPGLAPGGHHPARRHQLDGVGARAEVLAGRPTDGVGAVGLSPHPPAMATGHGHDAPAGQHPRAGDLAVRDHPGELDIDAVGAADIADGRDAGMEGCFQPPDAAQDRLGAVLAAQHDLRVRAGIQANVRVRVHEARAHPAAVERHDRRRPGPERLDIESRSDRGDPSAPDEDVDTSRPGAPGINDAGVAQDHVGPRLQVRIPAHTRTRAQRALRVMPEPP